MLEIATPQSMTDTGAAVWASYSIDISCTRFAYGATSLGSSTACGARNAVARSGDQDIAP
jgi:hypothetical protein